MSFHLVNANAQFIGPDGFQLHWNLPNSHQSYTHSNYYNRPFYGLPYYNLPYTYNSQSGTYGSSNSEQKCETLSLPLMMLLMTTRAIKSRSILPVLMMNSCSAGSSGMMPFVIALMKDDSSILKDDLILAMMMANNRSINIHNNNLMKMMLMKALMKDKDEDIKVPELKTTCDLDGNDCKLQWKMSLS